MRLMRSDGLEHVAGELRQRVAMLRVKGKRSRIVQEALRVRQASATVVQASTDPKSGVTNLHLRLPAVLSGMPLCTARVALLPGFSTAELYVVYEALYCVGIPFTVNSVTSNAEGRAGHGPVWIVEPDAIHVSRG